MIFMMQFFSRSFAAAVFALALIVARRRTCAGRHVGRAECDAGLFAKPRPADSDRGGLARNARQEKGSDLRRQREGRAGRHHHDLENAGGVLQFGPARRRASPPPAAPKGSKSGPMQSATPGPGGSSSIRRLEAKGSVVVTQKDQVVTGETAIFDTRANLITMVGGVVLTQCKNVLKRRSPQGRHDHRRVAGRIRQRQGAGHVHPGTGLRVGIGRGEAGAGSGRYPR